MIKLHKLLTVCAITGAVSSCGTSETESLDGTAEVTLALTADSSHNLSVKSQAEENLPDISDFTVEIFKGTDGKRLYRDTYANSTDKKIRLNAGSYNLTAFYGDSLKAGFNASYYQARVPFSITMEDRSVTVSGTARLAKVKVAVNYGSDLKEFYKQFVSSVSTDKKNVKDTLTFTSTEERAGFIPAGNLSFRLYAKIDGKWKVYKPEAIKCEPNDFITFNVNSSPMEGKLTIGIVIDNSTASVEREWLVSATDVATEAPEITFGSSFTDKKIEVMEGDAAENALVSVRSAAGIREAWLNVNSEYLTAKGVPAKVDLVNMDETVRKALDAAGIICMKMDGTTRFSGVDLSGMGNRLKDSASMPFKGTFSLEVTDKNGNKAESGEFSAELAKSISALNLSEANAYARSFRDFSVNAVKGNADKFTLQYKAASDAEWKNYGAETIDGNTLTYSRINGLSPATTYQFRVIYNGNVENCGDIISLTTEDAAQVENPGFEDWYDTKVYEGKVAWVGRAIYEWFPKASADAADYWATRNDLTTSQRSGASCYYTSYSGTLKTTNSHSGASAAEISTLNWGEGSTFVEGAGYALKNQTAGMLFIGSYTLNAEQPETYGRPFKSRPDYLEFYYKFAPLNSEYFKAYIVVENRDGGKVTELGRAELTGNETVENYTLARIPIAYSDKTLKATDMYIVFISSTAKEPTVQKVWGEVDMWRGYSDSRYVGNVLTVDDINLIYE